MGKNKIPSPSHIQAVMDIWSESGERTKFRVEGYCMSPIIKDGDIAHLVHRCKDIRVGDVVLYGEPGSYKLHRIVHWDKKRNLCLLKGDNSPGIDLPIGPSEMLAKVIVVEDGRSLIDFETWWWKLINPVIARASYLEIRIRARKSLFCRVMYVLGTVIWHRIGRLLMPNYLAWRLIGLRRVKVDRSTDP